MKIVVVIFRNQMEYWMHHLTSVYICNAEPTPEGLDQRGISTAEFLESQGITIQEMMEAFPECIEPNLPSDSWAEATWQTPLRKATLPLFEDGMRRLSQMLDDIPIRVYGTAYRGEQPRLCYAIN